MCIKTVNGPARTLSTTQTADQFEPLTPWTAVMGVNAMSFNVFLGTIGGNFRCKPAMQYASVRPDNPGSGASVTTMSIASYLSTAGYHYEVPNGGVPSEVAGVMFARWGVAYSASSGNAFADVGIDVSLDMRGRLVGRRTIDMQPWNNNTDVAAWPVSEWLPAQSVSKVKAAIVLQNMTRNNMYNRLLIRTANDRSAPDQWVEVESGWNNPGATGNAERCTGEVTVSVGSNYWMQVGFGLKSTNTASPDRATIHVAAAVVE